MNECASSPCRNGGVCEELIDDYHCTCPACYSGKNCQKRDERCPPNTFPPHLIAYNSTPAAASSGPQDRLIAFGLPLLLLLLLLICLLLAVVALLFIRVRKSPQSQIDGDLETSQNRRNEQRVVQLQCERFNNQLRPNPPVPPISKGSPLYFDLAPEEKIDNAQRYAAAVKANNLNAYSLSASKHTANTYKAVSLDKLNNKNQLVNEKSDGGTTEYPCSNPSDSPRRSLASPPPMMKTEWSKDSGLGSPSTRVPPSCSHDLLSDEAEDYGVDSRLYGGRSMSSRCSDTDTALRSPSIGRHSLVDSGPPASSDTCPAPDGEQPLRTLHQPPPSPTIKRPTVRYQPPAKSQFVSEV